MDQRGCGRGTEFGDWRPLLARVQEQSCSRLSRPSPPGRAEPSSPVSSCWRLRSGQGPSSCWAERFPQPWHRLACPLAGPVTPEDEPLPGGGGGAAGVSEQPEDKQAAAEPGDLPVGQRVRGRGKREGLGVVPKDPRWKGTVLPSPCGGSQVQPMPGPPGALRSRVPGGGGEGAERGRSKLRDELSGFGRKICVRPDSSFPHLQNQGKELTVLFLILIRCSLPPSQASVHLGIFLAMNTQVYRRNSLWMGKDLYSTSIPM